MSTVAKAKKPRRRRVFRMIAVDRPGYIGTQEDFETKAEAMAAAERFMSTHAPHGIPGWAQVHGSNKAYVMVEDRYPNGDHYTVAKWTVDYGDGWKLEFARPNPVTSGPSASSDPWKQCESILSGRRRNPSAADWADEMAKLRDIKPRPLHKLYGKRGPTEAQLVAWRAETKAWNRAYRHASKMNKLELAAQRNRVF